MKKSGYQNIQQDFIRFQNQQLQSFLKLWISSLKLSFNSADQKIKQIKAKISKFGYFSTKSTDYLFKKLPQQDRQNLTIKYDKFMDKIINNNLQYYQLDIDQEIDLPKLKRSILQKNQETIIQVIQSYIQQQDQKFDTIINFLSNLNKDNTQSQSDQFQQIFQSIINQKNTQNIHKQINQQKNKFIFQLLKKQISLNDQTLQKILQFKYNHGAFTEQIDKYIKEIPNSFNKKNIKQFQKKILICFQNLFRKIPQQILDRLLQLLAQKQISSIIQLIKKSQKQQIFKILEDNDFQGNDLQQIFQALVKLMPNQFKQQMINSLPSIQSLASQANINLQQQNTQPLIQYESTNKLIELKEDKYNNEQAVNSQSLLDNHLQLIQRQQIIQRQQQQKSYNIEKNIQKFQIPQHYQGQQEIKEQFEVENNLSIKMVYQFNEQQIYFQRDQIQKIDQTQFIHQYSQKMNGQQNKYQKQKISKQLGKQQINLKNQRNQNNQIFNRYVLVYHQRKEFVIIRNQKNQQLNLKPSFSLNNNYFTFSIYYLHFNEFITEYNIYLSQRQYKFQYLQSNLRTIKASNVVKKYWIQEYFCSKKSLKDLQFLKTIYFLIILNDLSIKGQQKVEQFFQEVKKNKIITRDIIKQCFQLMNKIVDQNFIITYQASNYLLKFLINDLKLQQQLRDYNSAFSVFFGVYTNFCHQRNRNNYNYHNSIHKPINILNQTLQNQKYSQVQLQIIINFIYIKIKYQQYYNFQNLIQYVRTLFLLKENFENKLLILQNLINNLPQVISDLKSLNISIKIDNKTTIAQFIIFRLTLFNPKRQIPILNQLRRRQILQILTQIFNYFQKFPNQVQYQQKQLIKLKKYQLLIHKIFSGQTKIQNHQKYQNKLISSKIKDSFIFHHNLMYQFMLITNMIQNRYKFDIKLIFLKNISENKIKKAIQYCVLSTQNSSKIIPFLCSFDNGKTLLKQIVNENQFYNLNNFVQIAQNWYNQHFKLQNNDYFIKIFSQLIQKQTKTQFNQVVQLLKNLDKNCNEKKKKSIQNFIVQIFKKIKKIPNLQKLRLHLTDIRQVKQNIRIPYLNILSIKIDEIRYNLQELQSVAQEIIFMPSINQEDKQIVLSRLLSNRYQKTKQMIKQQIIQCFQKGKRFIKVLGYYSSFKQILSQLVKQFQNYNIKYTIIDTIKKCKQKLLYEQYQNQIQLINNKVEQAHQKINILKNQFNYLNQVLSFYDQKFNLQIQYIKKWIKQLMRNKANEIIKNSQKYEKYLTLGSQIQNLMKIPLWKHYKIQKIQDLLIVRIQTIEQFDTLVYKFQQQQLNFYQFKKYFKIDILSIICSRIKDNKLQDKISKYVHLLDQRTLTHTSYSMKAINQLSQMLNKTQFFNKNDINLLQQLHSPNQNLKTEKAFYEMNNLKNKFKTLNFDILNQSEQILKTIKHKSLYQKVFKMISQKKIDSKTVVNDLKQYIHDVQNSILKIQDIKQLQNVVYFSQIISSCSNLQKFLQKLRKQVITKRLKLSENIFNINQKIKHFYQIIDSSANRQTSFKYDLQQILNHSIVKIKQDKSYAHIQIEILEKQKVQKKNKQQKDQIKIITFKKLTQFKEKAILSVSDFQRSFENQQIMKQTIDLFKKYLNFYKIIQEIQQFVNKAIIYGYDPIQLKHQKQVINGDFKEVIKMKQQIQQVSKDWISGMKQIYEKSFLLTHFMGPRLNNFINGIIKHQFCPLIKYILDINTEQLRKHTQSLRYMSLNQQSMIPINKVKKICSIFEKYQFKTLINEQKNTYIDQSADKNKILLITCQKVQNYYFALLKNKNRPNMNEVLYCQNETTLQQIQVFLKRAIIKSFRRHYFIGVHYLTQDVQIKFIDLLNEYLKGQKLNQNKGISKAKLVFIDNSTNEKVYNHLNKKQLFNTKIITDSHVKTNEQIILINQNIQQTYLIESKIPGLGKTYTAEQLKKDANIIYFPIAGHIDFTRLLQRLKNNNFDQTRQNTLIIQINSVDNKNKLQIFLFHLIFFKGFNFKQFFYLPKNTTIAVEIQNIFQVNQVQNQYPILNLIKQNKTKYIWIEKFQIEKLNFNFKSVEDSFNMYYFFSLLFKIQKIKDQQFKFSDFNNNFKKSINFSICTIQLARKIINQIFVKKMLQSKTQPTFSLYKAFMRLVFTAFKTFSQNPNFDLKRIQENYKANRKLKLDQVRVDFLKCCIMNSIQFLQATVNTNQFSDEPSPVKGKQFGQKLRQFPFLIISTHDFIGYQFVYLRADQVDVSIKSLIISQSIFKYYTFNKHGYQKSELERKLDQQKVIALFSQTSLDNLLQEQLERQLYQILYSISGNKKFYFDKNVQLKKFKQISQGIKNYSLTLDNFFKICLIFQRALSNLPIIIMGQAGVGKTALIQYLVEVVLQSKFLAFNIHAGIGEDKLIQFYEQMIKASDELKDHKYQKVWVFFDQFNTTNELGYIKQMLIDRRFQGQPLPQNIVMLAACNPYRKKNLSNYKHAGIKKRIVQNKCSQVNLAFKVKPAPLSMIQFMWDYQQLNEKENINYISKILQSLQLKQHQKIVNTLSFLHQQFKRNYQISSVSLRDVIRFKQLYIWFMKYMPKKNQKFKNPNYQMNDQQRAVSLSISFVYSLRVAQKQQRKALLKMMQQKLSYKNDLQKVVYNEQNDYVQRLKIPQQRIAINFSLRQNVFTTLICLMNKIPILIIGNPGNSKSLSIRMISANLKGTNSQSTFCQNFPELSIIYFQGSQTSTSKGVQAVFQKAIKSNLGFKKRKQKQDDLGQVQNCILFDEIGLAQKSIHNPLKVLHAKLQTNVKQICFIGISNWQLDAAKMSRCLVLSRSKPQKQQLRQTAKKILQSYLNNQSHKYEKICQQMADWYFEFIERWDQLNQGNYNEGFFGLRDFYCYIKQFADQLLKGKLSIQDIIRKSIYTNFDGQQGSVDMFLQIVKLNEDKKQFVIDPIRLVSQNLSKQSSRCLLLIVKGDALIPIINESLILKGQKQRVQCLYGSTFQLDQQSQQYNLQMTSIIIAHMSRGTILTFKNPNNSIQTSLYDVYNKSFTYSGPKKYCRVAVGANSNPQCLVHDNFGSIVFMDEKIIQNTDLAFLNRFQKHYLTLSSVLSSFNKKIVGDVKKWLKDLLYFKNQTQFKKQQHYLINSSQQSIATLVLKYKEIESQNQILRKIKKTLLKNATQHFYIALHCQEKKINIPQALKKQINELLKQIQKQNQSQGIKQQSDQIFKVIQDKIIFTYDQNIYSAQNYKYFTANTFRIRIGQIKSQKQLRKYLKQAFFSKQIDNIHILIDYHKEFKHINFIAFLATNLKNEYEQMNKISKKIYIIIKLSQSSLDNADKQHINISYLMNYQQRFINSMSLAQNNILKSLQNKSLKQLYIQRNMQSYFENYYNTAQTRFRFMDNNNQQNNRSIPIQTIKQYQLNTFASMLSNQIFKKLAKQFIYDNLNEDKINISIILNDKEGKMICTSPQESLLIYINNSIINLVCCFFDKIYSNNLMYGFNMPNLFNFYKKYYQVSIIMIIYQNNQRKFDYFFSKLLDTFIKPKLAQQQRLKKYNKQYNSNPLSVSNICILPMTTNDFRYITDRMQVQDSFFNAAQKILLLSVKKQKDIVQECRIQMQRCIAILKQKSVFFKKNINQFDFENYLNQNISLQVFYFFDLINKLYADKINTKVLPLQKIVYLFVYIFEKLKIKQKIILLSLHKQLWSYIFNIWTLWIIYNDKQKLQNVKDSHIIIYEHYMKNSIIRQQRNQPHQLPKLFIQLCYCTLLLQQQMLDLNLKTIIKYQIDHYIQFFRKTYFYIQKIKLSCEELDVQTSQRMKTIKRFLDLMEKLLPNKLQLQEQIAIFVSDQESSFEKKVQRYLNDMLINTTNKKQTQLILNYLSFDIYLYWIKKLLKQQSQIKEDDDQIKHCINSFIDYCNKYPLFANSSNFFFQCIFSKFRELNTIQERLDLIQNYFEQNQLIFYLINKKLTFNDNFTIALGNFFMIQIQQIYSSQIQGNDQKYFEIQFLQRYFTTFERFTKKSGVLNKILQIFGIQICKFYGLKYLKTIRLKYNDKISIKISQLLCYDSQNMSLIRLYILKNLLAEQKKMLIIKDRYLPNLKWLQYFDQMITGKSFQTLVPPSFKQQTNILNLIKTYRQEQYQNPKIFEKILQESFKNQITKYQFFTFMMNDIYIRNCLQDKVNQMRQIINKHPAYKKQQNKIQNILLNSYMNHQITNHLKYPQIHNENPSRKMQQFVNQQMVFINYLNILISCNKQQCPFIQMFFESNGCFPQNYYEYLEERFLIAGKQNLSVSILNGILQRNDMSSGYYKCSSKCDFIYIIGGNGYGCQNPSVRSKCVWCGEGLGGVGDRLDRINQGAKKYLITPQGTQLTNLRQQIRQKKSLMIKSKDIKLNGYVYSNNKKQILAQIQDNNRLTLTVKSFIHQIMFIFWEFIVHNLSDNEQKKLITKEQVYKIFKLQPKTFQNIAQTISNQLFNKIAKSNGMQQGQQNIIWHLGLSQQLMKFILSYNKTYNTSKKTRSLKKCLDRDNIEFELSNIILSMSSGNQKLSLINRSKTIKQGMNISSQGILKQAGKFETHLVEYPKIRLIKLVNFNKEPSLRNLIQEYKQIIKRDYPILCYFIDKEQQIQRLSSFRKIQQLCSKLLLLFNFKITRKDAEKKSILVNYEQMLKNNNEQNNENFNQNNQETLIQLKAKIQEFCEKWNEFRRLKFDLRYDCHTLGKMDQTTLELSIESPARLFLPDNRYKGDQHGQRLLAFLQVSASNYNIICSQIQKIRKGLPKYRDVQIFNQKKILPTQIQQFTNTLQLSQSQIQDFTYSFSNWSVQYGCNLPCYCIDKIQSLIVQNIIGSHILDENIKEYDSVNYIADWFDFISKLRQLQNQKDWDQCSRKQQIQRFIFMLKFNQPDRFMKEITTIKGSLEILLKYFKFQQNDNLNHLTIKQFMMKNCILINSKTIQKDQIFYGLQMKYILGLYEFIQLQTLKCAAECLDDSYKSQKLNEIQQSKIQMLLNQINQNNQQKDELYQNLSIALYRFASRCLSLVQINQQLKISQYILDSLDVWPKNYNLKKIKQLKYFNEAFDIPFTKMYSVLQKIPLQIKKTKTEVLLLAQKKNIKEQKQKLDNIHARANIRQQKTRKIY